MSGAERASELPALAREAIASALGGARAALPATEALAEPRGVFVTDRKSVV